MFVQRTCVRNRFTMGFFEGSFGLNVLGQPVRNHITFVVISAINHTAPLGAPGTEKSSINPASL